MRPVRRGLSPQAHDFAPYSEANAALRARLGRYCSYCERVINSSLAIEHMRPKSLHSGLEGRWDNFLLACGPCNSTKGTKDPGPAGVLWPDRDNTFVAFSYSPRAAVVPNPSLGSDAAALASATLSMVGLDKAATEASDVSVRMVASERVEQRDQAWGTALLTRGGLRAQPHNVQLQRVSLLLAETTGFFSVWMTVFDPSHAVDREFRRALIRAFHGTAASGCFDLESTRPVSPAPNPDGLPHGSKS